MKLTLQFVMAAILMAGTRVDAGDGAPPSGTSPSPPAAEDETQQGSLPDGADYPNVIVPHDTGNPERLTADHGKARTPAESVDDDMSTIALVEVGEVVAIPSLAQHPEWKQFDDRTHVGIEADGKTLITVNTGKVTGSFVSKDRRFLFWTVDEPVTTKGRTGTRPTVTVTRRDSSGVSQDRYGFAVKSVRPGQRGIEPKMQLRGGIKSVADGVTPGTFDVYLEIALPGGSEEDAKKILVCGTFATEAIQAATDRAQRVDSFSMPPTREGSR